MRNIYKYSFILGLVLLLTSVLFLSFKLEDKPSTSKTPDEYIASYIEGEYQIAIPGKDDGYVVDKIVCDNGATATWNTDEWGIDIRNASKKVKCSIYFEKATIADQITTLATTDTTNFATDDPDNNIRYIGANPDNHIYFNCSDYSNQSDSTCEKWRIIGVFKNMTKEDGTKEDLVKIIRDDSLENIAWASSDVNDWSTASLQTTLNVDYFNGTYATGAFKNDSTRNAIESIVWNLGGSSTENDVTANMFYKRERETTVYSDHATIWTGKVGLMYPSDYGYATSGNSTTDRATCLAKELYGWFTDDWESAEDCYSNDYLFEDGYEQWTLVPNSSNARDVFRMSIGGFVYSSVASADSESARPVVFLKSSISISKGDGSNSNPYRLKLQ